MPMATGASPPLWPGHSALLGMHTAQALVSVSDAANWAVDKAKDTAQAAADLVRRRHR
jgi:hypothetical protein